MARTARWIERATLGAAMVVVAWFVERRLLRAVERRQT
jgi:hypothetical protein